MRGFGLTVFAILSLVLHVAVAAIFYSVPDAVEEERGAGAASLEVGDLFDSLEQEAVQPGIVGNVSDQSESLEPVLSRSMEKVATKDRQTVSSEQLSAVSPRADLDPNQTEKSLVAEEVEKEVDARTPDRAVISNLAENELDALVTEKALSVVRTDNELQAASLQAVVQPNAVANELVPPEREMEVEYLEPELLSAPLTSELTPNEQLVEPDILKAREMALPSLREIAKLQPKAVKIAQAVSAAPVVQATPAVTANPRAVQTLNTAPARTALPQAVGSVPAAPVESASRTILQAVSANAEREPVQAPVKEVEIESVAPAQVAQMRRVEVRSALSDASPARSARAVAPVQTATSVPNRRIEFSQKTQSTKSLAVSRVKAKEPSKQRLANSGQRELVEVQRDLPTKSLELSKPRAVETVEANVSPAVEIDKVVEAVILVSEVQAIEVDATFDAVAEKEPAAAPAKARKAPSKASRRGGATANAKGKKKATGGSGGRKASARGKALSSTYKGTVRAKIRRKAKYPRGTRAAGSAEVAFMISPSGSIFNIKLAKSSGNGRLDRAALAAVKRAAPFPRFPAGSTTKPIPFHVSITMKPK